MIKRDLFSAVALALCLVFSSFAAVSASESPAGTLRDLKSIVDAQVLRGAVTRFDLPSFHVRAADGKLFGPRSTWHSKLDAPSE